MLREKSISTPYDLVSATPGIAATTGSSQRNDVLYFIRGQGATFGSSPSVVTYFADVPQQTNSASGGSNITFHDLETRKDKRRVGKESVSKRRSRWSQHHKKKK